jgi:hypothetical protein
MANYMILLKSELSHVEIELEFCPMKAMVWDFFTKPFQDKQLSKNLPFDKSTKCKDDILFSDGWIVQRSRLCIFV